MSAKYFVAGGDTLLGRALIDRLRADRENELVGVPPDEPELTSMSEVEHFFAAARPDVVVLAAGSSGGILANQSAPANLLLDNLLVGAHVLAAAFQHNAHKLLYLGSSCMYPRSASQPLRPDSLQTGPLEPSSAAYATAKLAGLALCQAYRTQYGAPFISAIPANAFGPHDDFHAEKSHVVPALIRRLHEAKRRGDKSCAIWGTGLQRREFIFAADLAEACLFAIDQWDEREPINLGSGEELTIGELAALIADIVGYGGELRFDHARPEGAPRKCLDSDKLFGLGWRPSTGMRAGLEATYAWYVGQVEPRHARVAV